jgi:hypothetical protein
VLHFGGAYVHEITELDGTRRMARERGTERLEVNGPSGISIGPKGSLLVDKADEVRFGWHLYPEPQTPENWCVLIYRRCGDEVEHSIHGRFRPRNGPPLPERFPVPSGPFVRLSP